MHLMLSQRRLRWLGYVHRMEDGQIPKDVLYGELAMGRRPVGHSTLCYKDVCKRDLKLTDINTGSWESLARGSQRLASSCAGRSQKRRGEEKQTDGREKNEEETETGSQPSDPIHLQHLWQRLSCQDWAPEPLQPLLSTSLRTNQGAYHCLSRQTVAYYMLFPNILINPIISKI